MACLTHSDSCSALFPGVPPSSSAHSQPVTASAPPTNAPLVGPAVPMEVGELAFTFYLLFSFSYKQKLQAVASKPWRELRLRELGLGIEGPGDRRATGHLPWNPEPSTETGASGKDWEGPGRTNEG